MSRAGCCYRLSQDGVWWTPGAAVRGAVRAFKPKKFAGILSAAPSVALAGLAIGSGADGPLKQAAAAHTMIAGAIGLTVYAMVAVPALHRLGAAKDAAVASSVWASMALAVYPVLS